MFVIIKSLHSILKLLNSETSPWQIAAGVAFGSIVGFTPVASLHNLLLFFLVCLLRVNLSMFFMSFGFFKIIGWLLDPVWDRLGYFLLVELKAARPLWIEVSTGPILPFFRFNNTIVIGSLVTSLILFFPILLASAQGVKAYRLRWRERLKDSKLVKILKATPLYGIYEKYEAAKQKFGILSSS